MTDLIDFLLTYPRVFWCFCLTFLVGALLGAFLQFTANDKKRPSVRQHE